MYNTDYIVMKIKALLAQKGWTQATLAYRSGVKEQTITRLMKHKKQPYDDTLEKIASALDVYKGYLTGELKYKDFDAWLQLYPEYDMTDQQREAVFNLLVAWGYKVSCTSKGIYEVICPDGTIKKMIPWHLQQFTMSYLSMMESHFLPVELFDDRFEE